MVSPKRCSLAESSVPCDFCNEQTAILYCRADSAKLCLLCDHHVHSANALSRKHLRSQICDNCASEPVSVRCATDNLVLCQDCDWDAHATSAVSAAHDRIPLDPFSGCPSALELASAWGLELQDKKPSQPPNWFDVAPAAPTAGGFLDSSWTLPKEVSVSPSVLLQDLMVPTDNNNPSSAVIFSNCGPDLMKKHTSPSCGKQRLVIMKQLMGLLERDMADGGGGEELGPGTPNASGGGCCGVWQGNEEVRGLGNGGDGVVGIVNQQFQPQQHQRQQEQQNAPFMSLLMMQTPAIPKERDRTVARNMWTTTACEPSTQIWDFNLGQLRGNDESNTLEVGYSANEVGFMMKSYSELLKEPSSATTRGLELSGLNCSIVNEDMAAFNLLGFLYARQITQIQKLVLLDALHDLCAT
ncbi:zinc finger protein CONSTANS-LIKE 15-like isoform X2 [Coffea eugenioides]|uniref:zinc finger protein CONSTANS-LIKE 15-like isoform X2 n=1 Tax=Coffea eugenioides TaxID=49369 RepID=UPI000F604FE1|nr:zinc finger protein CONSTANS-LIKE 15-like isoform X2 [Coffea eugenioides]